MSTLDTLDTLDSELRDEDDETMDRWNRPSGARVVVVDDDVAMRELVAARLEADGYDVYDAGTGAELLRMLEDVEINRFPFDGVDLIVLDHRMPGMTGLQAIRKLRAAHWDTPAILMTAFPDESVTLEAAHLGVSVLAKPFSLDLLTNTVLANILSKTTDTTPTTPSGVPS